MKFDRILFPVDFTDESRLLDREVEWLAERFQSKVTLLHVDELPANRVGEREAALFSGLDIAALREDGKRRLQNYALAIPETRLERGWLQGDAAHEIVKWCSDFGPDLIVLRTKVADPLCGVLLGSIVMKVLHQADCPVWIESSARREEARAAGIATILCPIELTSETGPLLRFAKDVATTLNAGVQLLHSLPDEELRAGHTFIDRSYLDELRETAAEEIATQQGLAGTAFPCSLTSGLVTPDTTELAREMKADLIIIGRGHAQRAFGSLRTHSFDIIWGAGCPVLSYSAHWKKDRLADHTDCAERAVITHG